MIFDPSHASPMLRNMPSSPTTTLSIARHTMQFIFHSTLQLPQGDQPLGLLLGQDVSAITQAMNFDFSKQTPLPKLIAQKELQILGVFQTEKPNAKSMPNVKKQLQALSNKPIKSPYIHLHLSFDTLGCLQSEAWVLHNKKAQQASLLLVEDGQQEGKS